MSIEDTYPDHRKAAVPSGSQSKVTCGEGLAPESQIGSTLEALAATLHQRHLQAGEESYTHRLIAGDLDVLLKKICEEALETALAAKDVEAICPPNVAVAAPAAGAASATAVMDAAGADRLSREKDHLRYEAADVLYHVLVLLEREGIPLDELAAELNARMGADELAGRTGIVALKPEHINRGNHIEK